MDISLLYLKWACLIHESFRFSSAQCSWSVPSLMVNRGKMQYIHHLHQICLLSFRGKTISWHFVFHNGMIDPVNVMVLKYKGHVSSSNVQMNVVESNHKPWATFQQLFIQIRHLNFLCFLLFCSYLGMHVMQPLFIVFTKYILLGEDSVFWAGKFHSVEPV